jgi:hydrogenase-1 operon protein HyaF
MSKLEDISVRVETDRPKRVRPDIVNLVLHEIHAGLTGLLADGHGRSIDLRQLPRMSAEIYQDLRDALSKGEVSAVVDAQIRVEVAETRYPGVWWLRHLNERGEITNEIIEITAMPVILKPHPVDIAAGMKMLHDQWLSVGDGISSAPFGAVPV